MHNYREHIHKLTTFLESTAYGRTPRFLNLQERVADLMERLGRNGFQAGEYFFHIWDETAFQISLLERLYDETAAAGAISLFYYFHQSNTIYSARSILRDDLAKNALYHVSFKRFLQSFRQVEQKLTTAVMTRCFQRACPTNSINDLSIVHTGSFTDLRRLEVILLQNPMSAEKPLARCIVDLLAAWQADFRAIHFPLQKHLSQDSPCTDLAALRTHIDQQHDPVMLQAILSTHLLLGPPFLYYELRGLIIEKYFKSQAKQGKKVLRPLATQLLNKVEQALDADAALEHLLFLCAGLIDLARIRFHIHRTNIYQTFERLKVVDQDHITQIERVERDYLACKILYVAAHLVHGADSAGKPSKTAAEAFNQLFGATLSDLNIGLDTLKKELLQTIKALIHSYNG